VQLVTEPDWAAWASLVLVLAPVALARSRTVPDAVRLGADADPPAEMLRLARTTLGDHVFCFVAVAALLAVQLVGHFV